VPTSQTHYLWVHMGNAITLGQVDRNFGEIPAVRALSLDVPEGSITVLLGPNGAGKTTTVRLITGALRPDAGRIEVHGMDPADHGEVVRRRCGVVPPKPAMYDRLTGRENLGYAAALYGVGREGITASADRFGIADALDLEVGGYSTGMRTRLALARAFLHDPDVLLLDEPTAGLDPESARDVLSLITELATTGRTVVMCTHLLHEAEGIADQVALMVKGTARVVGHPRQLADQYFDRPVVVIDAEDRSTLAGVAEHPRVRNARWNGGLEVEMDALASLPDLVADLVTGGARLTRVEPRTGSLADLYFEMQRIHGDAS
jgi:ABC-2 type transport system ATP-binding protein